MKILLTGAAGFIGSHLAGRLLDEGHDVIGVDNFCSGQRRNLAPLMDMPGFRLLEKDVIQPFTVDQDLDWVMHFASLASPPKYLAHPIETLRVNSEGTRHLLELARQKGAQFFFSSTSEVYGDPLVHPQPESYWGNVNPNGVRSVYDEAKRYAEALIMAYHRSFGLPIRIIRIFNTYGPNMDLQDGRVVTNFIQQVLTGQALTIYGDGSQTRSFQYIDDLVEGILCLMKVEYFAPLNLGNPEEYTIKELAELIKTLSGSEREIIYKPLPQDDPKQRKPDISRAREILNWEPQVAAEEGLTRTIQYFRSIIFG
jgi:nucleoside-diphosphate-sugar epimerase